MVWLYHLNHQTNYRSRGVVFTTTFPLATCKFPKEKFINLSKDIS